MTTKLDARQLRNCFGQWATGVAIVGYELDGEQRGATINGFTSVSMDPPLVLVSFARTARASQTHIDRVGTARRLHVGFRHTDVGWRIADCRTENLFTGPLPVNRWQSHLQESVLTAADRTSTVTSPTWPR